MMKGDTHEAARKAVAKLNDRRARHFYDPQKMAGRAFAGSLGREDSVAWDFYLFYPPRSEWAELPPRADVYMHQLPGGWPDQSRLFEKDRLVKKLTETMELLFS
ncbi:MAG: hypothetical protein JW793_03600 [Acidobacteria bacterium]|nr:hypothetical protein [Acidobacteriota bacterium]